MRSFPLKIALLLISVNFILAGSDAMGGKGTDQLRDSIIGETVKLERDRVLAWAEKLLTETPVTITAFPAARSAGELNDFYSEGPYWWPDPENPDGPFIRKDGLRYPGMFKEHSDVLGRFSWIVSIQTSAYLLTGDERYARAAVKHLKAWFIDPATMMNPNMTYSQAIKGICTGRGIGIIDAVPLIEVAQAVNYLGNSPFVSDEDIYMVTQWFDRFLNWLTTHQYGIDEMNARNNHGSWWHAQAAAYAKLTGNRKIMQLCQDRLFNIMIPNQMADNGSFPEELARTKPYGYSLYNMDALAMLAWILSDETYDVWLKTLPDGRGIPKGIGFIIPYVRNKTDWPYDRDITGWENQPERRTFILLASIAQQNEEWFAIWKELTAKIDRSDDTVAGSFRTPILWLGLEDPNTGRSFRNPVIPGFNPDPSICRVGDDYYLATSTFEYFPGVPVYHSRDMVNWEIVGHALDRPSQLNLDSINCSGGIYAPTLRYHNGTFYMITTLTGEIQPGQPRGNLIVTATDPAGPWSEPHWIENAPGIDPSLFFDDDGKVYYCGNISPGEKLWDKHRNIWAQEIDLKKWKLTGTRVEILDAGPYYMKGTIDGGMENGVNNFESPHIYKKGDYYYLMIAHGGTSQNHSVSIWRSKNIFGPYEMNPSNPILTHRDLPKTFPITSTGHADLVQAADGSWWMVYLGKRPYGGEFHILGRETFLSPVEWNGAWPVVNPDEESGRSKLVNYVPGMALIQPAPVCNRDNFDKRELNKYWTFIRTPRTKWWSVNAEEGVLSLDLRPESIDQQVNPSFIGRRLEHIDYEATVKMSFIPERESEEAGLVVERDRESYIKFSIIMDQGSAILGVTKREPKGTGEERVAQTPINIGTVFLKIKAEGVTCTMSYSLNGTEWLTLADNLDSRFLGLYGMGRFTGTFIGMYASSNGMKSTNHADFDWFEYK